MKVRQGSLMAWYRYGMERVFLLPAGRLFPRRVGHVIALGLGAADLATGMGRLARRQFRSSHGMSGWPLWRTSWRWCAVPYLDLLHLARATRGWADDPSRTGVRVHVSEDVREYIRSGKPLVFVGGHFPFAWSVAAVDALRRLQAELRADTTTPVGVVIAGAGPARRQGGPLRDRLRSAQFHRLFCEGAGSVAPVQLIEVWRQPSLTTGRQLVTLLQRPGAMCFVAIDRPWDAASTYRRPFAGWNSLPLSTGPARLAIRANAGMPVGTLRRAGSFGYEIELGRVLQPTPGLTPQGVTATFADELERLVGLHPAEYMLSIGYGRTWDAREQRWASVVEPATASVAVALAAPPSSGAERPAS